MNIKETFAGALRLPARVAVYVPGTSGPAAADPALAEKMTEATAARLSAMFGGATIQPASGAWVSEVAGLIREAVNIVYAFGLPEQIDNNAGAILELVEQIKAAMRQEAVSVEINGALYLV